jgi:hypothetical protein
VRMINEYPLIPDSSGSRRYRGGDSGPECPGRPEQTR